MTKKILVVEDNELNLMLFRDMLDSSGYKTLTANNGVEAIEIARDEMPDLILMDIQLPDISGLEITKRLKEDKTLKAIPVIALTAFAMKGDEERFRAGGCDGYMSKPVSRSEFLETVHAFTADKTGK